MLRRSKKEKEAKGRAIYIKCTQVINSCVTLEQTRVAEKFTLIADRHLTNSQSSVLYDYLFDKYLEIKRR